MCRRDINASPNVFGSYTIIEGFLDSANSGFSTETTKPCSLPKTAGVILVINIKIESTEKHRVSVI